MEAIAVAKMRIDERIAAGEEPRSDDFFTTSGKDRSDSEELLEGVLLAAQREYEERKILVYGNLYASVAFEPAIDSVTANALLREANDLSYTHIQLLALVARQDQLPLPQTSERSGGGVSWRATSIRYALDDLGYARRELVAARRRPDERLPTNVSVPADLQLTPRGNALYVLMQLDQLGTDELRPIAAALWEFQGSQPPWEARSDE